MKKNDFDLPPIPVSFQALLSEISRLRPDLANQISPPSTTSATSPTPYDLSFQIRRLTEGISTSAIALGALADSPHQARTAAMMASDALHPRPHESPQDSEERLGLFLSNSYEKLSRSITNHPQNLMGRAWAREISENLTRCYKSPTTRQSVRDEISRIAEMEHSSPVSASKLLAHSLDKASLLEQAGSLGSQSRNETSAQRLKAPSASQGKPRPSLGPNVCQR